MLQMLLVLTTTLAHFVVKLLWFLYPDWDPHGSREENPKANFPKMLVYGTFYFAPSSVQLHYTTTQN